MASPAPFHQAHPRRRVVVTAAGVVSPLGVGMEENHAALRDGCDGISPVHLFDARGCRSTTAGQVDTTRLPTAPHLPARHSARLHRAGRMLLAAYAEALTGDPGFRPEAAVIGTTAGGMSYGEAFFRALPQGHARKAGARQLAHYAPQKAVIDTLAAFGTPHLPCQIIANACASGTNSIGHAFQLVAHGLRDRVVAGGYDTLSEMVFVGFDSLQASSPERCRPFDRDRSGLIMGEGAAILTLESLETARERSAPILAEITGYGISTDNYHLTQPDPSGIGPLRAMRQALESAGCPSETVDYLNAHGTATPFNDATEGAAIEAIFGPEGVPVSSTKALTGHALGAAGSIEAVFCLLALRHQFLPPNAFYREADPQWRLDIVANTARPARVRRVLSNSFGFGGTNASLLMEGAPS